MSAAPSQASSLADSLFDLIGETRVNRNIFVKPAGLGLTLYFIFAGGAWPIGPVPACVAVASDVNGLFVANVDGTPLAGAPVIERLGATQAALSPDRQTMVAEFASAPGVLILARLGTPPSVLPIPENLTLGYPISSLRWDSDSRLRVARNGRLEREYQFLTLTAGSQGMVLMDAMTPLVGADCLMLPGNAQGLCASGAMISINDAPIQQFSGRMPRSIPPARVLLTAPVRFGSTAMLISSPAISLTLGAYDEISKVVMVGVENPEFGFTEGRLGINDEIRIVAEERQFRISLSGLTSKTAVFTVFEAGSRSGFLAYEHVAQVGSATSGYLIYSMRSASGTELLGLAGVFDANSAVAWLDGVAEAPMFRVRNTSAIRGLGNSDWVQVDDTEGAYLLPIAKNRIWVAPVATSTGGILTPGFYDTKLVIGRPTFLPKTVKSKFNPSIVVEVKEWQCR